MGRLYPALLVAFAIASAIWAYRDAKSRQKPAWAVAILVCLTPVVGLLVWIIVRPDYRWKS